MAPAPRPAGSARLLVVLGLIAIAAPWGDTSSPGWHTLGALAEAPFIALNFYICLAYPVGRLSTTLERFLIWTWSLVLAVTYRSRRALHAGGQPERGR